MGTWRRLALILIVGVSISGPVRADIDSVYAPAPPADAAFVRFVNLSGAPVEAHLERGGRLRLDAGKSAGRYEIVPAGRLSLRFTGRNGSREVSIPVQQYATCILRPGGQIQVMMDDAADFNLLKARLSFYNLSRCAQAGLLALGPEELQVFAGIGRDRQAQRQVNPVRVRFLARCDAPALETPPLPPPALRAGQRHSLFLIDAGAGIRLIDIADTTAPAPR